MKTPSCRLPSFRGLGLGLALALAPFAAAQIADEATAVPVHFQGLFTALATGDPDEPAYARITPLAPAGAWSAAYGESPASGEAYTGDGFARLRPGKSYYFEINSHSVTRIRVKVTPPAGQRVIINGVEHEMFDWALGDGGVLPPHGAFSLRLDDGSGAPVGQADSLRPGRVLWSVGLGNLRNGRPAGNLRLVDDGITANTFRPAGLYFDRDSGQQDGCYTGDDGEVLVVKVGGVLRQVYATSVLADIEALTAHAYRIRLFPREQVGGQDAQQVFGVTGAPLHEFTVENPTPPTLNALRLTRATAQNGSLTMWTQLTKQTTAPAGTTQWIVDDWVEKPLGATAVVSPVRHRWTYTDSDRNELFEILDAAGTPVQSTFKRFSEVAFGTETTRELEYEIAGYGGAAPLQTNYTYHTNPAAPGHWRRVKTVSATDGSWTAFSYYDDFATRGQVRQTRRPHGNSPAVDPGLDASAGEVTTYTYGHVDHWGTRRLPTRIQTSLDGILTARSDFLYTEETLLDQSATYSDPAHAELAVVVTERRDYFNATQYLVTKTRTYREDADPQYKFFPGLVRSVERPDRTMTVAVYFHASYNGETAPFTAGPNGLARAHVVLQGTHDTSTGVPMPWYPVSAQALPANFRLVSGKSGQSRTLVGEHGLPLVTEQQAYVDGWIVTAQEFPEYTSSLFPTATQRRTGSTGPRWATSTRNWIAGRLAAVVDDTGNRQTFTYDTLGRVQTTTREGATAQGATIAAQTTTQGYDAAGRLTSRSVSALGESLVHATTYDTAGRVTSESAPGIGLTTHSYQVATRTHTTTLPTGATRIETRLVDGRLASVEGTAAVAEHYQYAVEADGRRKSTVRPRNSADVRLAETWTDWLNRPIQRAHPGFNGASTLTETMTYDLVTGQLTSLARPGYSNTHYQYNSMGERVLSGLDLDGGGLTPASRDRLTESDQSVEAYAGAHWITRRHWIFATYQSGTRTLQSLTRQRLTGLSATLRAETRTRDAEDNETTRTVSVDAASKLVTVTTTAPGLASAATELALAGFAIVATGHDGLTTRTAYDALGRPQSATDPRGGTSTTTYRLHTTLPDERRDRAGRLVAKTTYDNAGRPISATDAGGRTVFTAYTLRGEVSRRWGSGTVPVAYDYDAYGQRTHQRTYRGGTPETWAAPTWPGDALPAQVTEWEYDAPTGLLRKKYDPERKFVEFTYNERGQILQRFWARRVNGERVATTYDYFTGTGELRGITYNDSTPAVSYVAPSGDSLTRLGQPIKVTDGTGTRTLNYDSLAPWRFNGEELSSYFGSRKLQNVFESATQTQLAAGGYAAYTLGTVKGRTAGYRLMNGTTPAHADLEVTYAATNAARFAGLTSRRANGAVSRQFVYGYEPAAAGLPLPLVKSLSIVGLGFQATRTFATDHDLPTALDTLWDGASRARFDYGYNSLLQRATLVQTGTAFSDLGGTHQRFTYNPRGELTSAYSYSGTDPASVAQPLAGRLHDYTYDTIGNRQSSNTSGTPDLRDDYVPNDRNQYTQRENNTLTVGGTLSSNPNARVAVSGPAPLPPTGGQLLAGRQGNFWGTNLAVSNESAPFHGSVSAYAVLPGAAPGGADLIRKETRTAFLPPAVQTFTYDDDGNLRSDGLWDYTWDAENRLASMSATAAAIAVGRAPLTLVFRYDHRHRRVAKEVRTGATFTLLTERRYVHDGWNVIAELDGSAALKRSFAWGLDLNGGIGTAGGVGGLLQIHDAEQNKTLLPAFDANGNVAALINADTGATEASYEYSPFGELLRSAGAYALANPFRFSTKWQDDESGLLYYGYRLYAPREGRFINRDPIEEQGGLNLYGFCGNDGINQWDYLGQKSWLSKLWSKFRHTIISAAFYAIPGAGLAMGTLYNIGVGARYGGLAGAGLALASSGLIPGQIGGLLSVGSQAYGLYNSFKSGSFLNNFGNWFLGSALANASFHLADRIINGPKTFPAVVDLGPEERVDRKHLTEFVGQFQSREQMSAFLTSRRGLDPYGSGTFLAELVENVWQLHKVDGIHTNVVYANGIQGLLGRHMSLGVGHLFKRFSDLTQFTIAHNRSHGGFLDILEAGGDLLGIPSKSALKLASALQTRLSGGHGVHLVSHSQGFATTISALRLMALDGARGAGLTVYPHAGAGNSFHAAALATSLGAKMMPHVFSSFDMVPGIVGMNGNPLQVVTGLIGLPSLFGPESKSAHTLPNVNPDLAWLRWGPGN